MTRDTETPDGPAAGHATADDIRQAFAHPSERAEATAGPGRMLDRISLRGHVTQAEIGAFQAERGTTQRLRFDVVVEVVAQGAAVGDLARGAADDVDRILSYDRLTEAIAAELSAERLNLLETLAERIAARILTEPMAARVFLRVEKLDRGPGALGVEIVREPGGARDQGKTLVEVPHPLIAHLSGPAMQAAGLSGLIDRLAGEGRPLILTVSSGDIAPPRAAAQLAQRRIDLLALEQAAWVLAGRDRRCIVTGSRTELDWGMRHDQIAVWAPSKMVLDAADSPGGADALELCLWLARAMAAVEVRVIGGDVPDVDGVTVTGQSLSEAGL